MSNIHSLSSASKKDNDKKGVEEFGSFGKSSGTAVQRRTDGPSRGQNVVDDLVSQAKNRDQNSQNALDKSAGNIILYKNGFILGTGKFRDAKEPQNAKFLEQLKNRVVPEELEEEMRKQFGGTEDVDVSIQLVNKTNENYAAPKAEQPKFDFSQSKGNSLGSDSKTSVASVADFAKAVAKEYVLDKDSKEPTTDLQIVLHDRSKVKAKFLQSATVLQLYQHVMAVSKKPKFDLIAGFPPKPLVKPSVTLKAAGVLNTSIQQRCKS
eukprot:TRINITY_DN715_c0_g1_i1.p1 TRINITY_DN715_c0_g1~~TRINITY_DN715_c0_g1_i1.p1  ORF type:complete len:275 (-),score=75.37 TRINITY_DN715_c0_g1_i1:135-929(-)